MEVVRLRYRHGTAPCSTCVAISGARGAEDRAHGFVDPEQSVCTIMSNARGSSTPAEDGHHELGAVAVDALEFAQRGVAGEPSRRMVASRRNSSPRRGARSRPRQDHVPPRPTRIFALLCEREH